MGSRCVALLRGINVGGRNLISMGDLRSVFERAGYESVQTYIQSGNVVFETNARRESLERSIEGLLADQLGTAVLVVVRSHRQLANLVAAAPAGFGSDPDAYLYDVVFLKGPLTSTRALRAVSLREGVDQVRAGTGVLYLSRVAARRSQSRLSKLASTPEYQQMTIRNWATTTRLLAMLETLRSDGAPPKPCR